MADVLQPLSHSRNLPSRPKATILLVDDNPANLLSLRAILEELGHNLVEALSGEEALQRVRSDEFAVILLDVLMPGLSGFETAQRIRAGDRSRHTPIIFLTAGDIDRSQMEEGYSLGAVDFLVKPLLPFILQAKVRGFIELFQDKQQARREAEQLRLLVHGTTDYAIFMLDPTGYVLTWNSGAERLKGYKAEEIIGQHFSRFYPSEAIERDWPNHELQVARKTGRFEDEGWRVRKDGTQFWANVVITALQDQAGNFLGFSKITRDLTERKRLEENAHRLVEETTARRMAEDNARQIQEQRERLHVTLASIGDAVISTDVEGRIDFLNPVAEDLVGWKLEEAAHRTLEDVFRIVNENTRLPVENPALRALQDGVTIGLANHTVLISKEGAEHPIDDSAAPIRDARGQIVGSVLVFRDISERKRAEESSRYLADASAALASVVDYESTLQKVANLAVPHFADWATVDLVKDGSLHRLAVAHQNPDKIQLAHELMRHYPPDPQAKGGIGAVFRTGKPEMVSEITEEMLVQGARDERHLRLIRSLGLKSFICVPLVVTGNTLGVLSFATAESGRRYNANDLALARDLAHRAAVAIENTQLYQALRETDRRKDEFLATLAHELRNPLAPIRNSLQILKMPRVDAEMVKRSRDMMERQVHHLVRLVDDLLDVSRVMRGKIDLRMERIELASVVARAVETVQPLIEAQGHELIICLPNDSLPLEADPVRLAQVVGNLLTNAAKYTDPNGRIWVTAAREGDEAVLRVQDTGIGLAPDMLPQVFELFVQADHSFKKAQGGLGIGLTLVKNLVEMHKGTVEAHSAGLGQGCEFVIRLPLVLQQEAESEEKEPNQQPQAVTGHRLLVVDDNRDAALSLAMLLRLHGHDVQVAHDGPAALQLAAASRPDLMFLDIGMPGMDGYEVARRMRETAGLEKVVLVALTGWGQQEDRRRSKEAGFDHHLVKPPELQALERLLSDLATC